MIKFFSAFMLFFSFFIFAETNLKENETAPLFKLLTHEGHAFNLLDRKGIWTVLYFFPMAETPGCTKQACAFRDNIKAIRSLKAEVYGISTDTVEKLSAFHKNHQLNFTLLADDKLEVTKLYGSKMPLFSMSKRWTFIIDPELKIRWIDRDVDPVLDAKKVATKIEEFKDIQ